MSNDVLVVGAGPTGLSLAITLRRYGVRVRIVDRLAEPAPVSKALAVWSATLEALQSMGIVEAFLAAGRRMHAVRIGDGGHEIARVTVGRGIDSAFPYPVLLSQARTEAILRDRLAALGVAVERGVELTGLDQDDDGVTARLRHADGAEETARARYLVGSDGARSAVRHELGIAFEGLTEPQTFLLGDVRIDGGDLDDRSLYIWWRHGTVALFPFEAGVWRVLTARADAGDQSPPTVAELQAGIDRSGPPGLRLHDPGWLSAFHINERLAARYRVGRCFLAGDAAHIHSPAGGQGMNTGIHDGVNLGWKLAQVLRGHGDAAILLDSYEAERRPTARAVVDESTQRQHLAFNSGGRLAELAKDAALAVLGRVPAVQRMLQVQLSETAIVYRDGKLVALGSPPSRPARGDAGTRALDAAWRDPATGEARTLWPLLSGPGHTLLVCEDAPGQIDVTAALTGTQDRVRVLRFDPATDADGAIRARYRLQGVGWVLIRPDHVVGARGGAADIARLGRYLDRVVR